MLKGGIFPTLPGSVKPIGSGTGGFSAGSALWQLMENWIKSDTRLNGSLAEGSGSVWTHSSTEPNCKRQSSHGQRIYFLFSTS